MACKRTLVLVLPVPVLLGHLAVERQRRRLRLPPLNLFHLAQGEAGGGGRRGLSPGTGTRGAAGQAPQPAGL